MKIYYKSYRYCDMATSISAFANILALMFLILGIALPGRIGGVTGVFMAILFLGLAPFLAFYVGRKWTDKIAEKHSWENITTKADVGLLYVEDHPEEYERIRGLNAAFAEKYMMDTQGKIVKRN